MRISLVLSLVLLLSSCAPGNTVKQADSTPVQNVVINEKTSSQTNYKLGEVKSVFVGDEMIRKRTDKIKTQSKLVAVPLMNASLVSQRIKLILLEGKSYPIEYQVKRDEMPYRVINVRNNEISNSEEIFGVMFDNNGILYNKVLENGNEVSTPLDVIPLNAAVKVSSTEEEVSRETLEDYQITYAGSANGQIRLLYRETVGNAAGLTQELTYPADSQEIRFKTIKIKMHKVSPESIIYEVEGQ